jgi:prolyl-tRNA editing enzyme YbaK/EbsC (Cys-tRNA(Pro) deacylase)
MFRTIVIALTVASASAFVAAPRAAAPKTVMAAFESELGAQPPLGCWDPLGILENADQDRFDRLREVEIKHGRVSMLAVLGHITTSSGVRLGGNIDFDGDKFADIPTGLAALGAVPPFGMVQIFFFVGFLEV